MIGFWDYTVILTYGSLLSAVAGIVISMSGAGHPFYGILFLLISGLCDTFDGRVARKKLNRTEIEKQFGVQIDSLADLVAFGVLPISIGAAIYKRALIEKNLYGCDSVIIHIPIVVIAVIIGLYVLAALVRLAYFNVTVEETQSDKEYKFYYGLPVTAAALVFPTFMLIYYILLMNGINISFVYFILLLIVGVLFIIKFRLKKPDRKMIRIMISIGAVEFIALMIIKLVK